MSVGNEATDSDAADARFGSGVVALVVRQRWVFGIILIGIALVGLGLASSGLLSGLVGAYGLLLVVIGVLIYLFLFLLQLRMGD